jgi:two-component system, NarL family, invasion response regulator UvrY
MPEDPFVVKLALVDDHKLFRKGLISLLEMCNIKFTVLFEADNGFDMQMKIDPENIPHVILMDVNMPGMDGFDSVEWLTKIFPQVKVLVVSMIQREETIVRMLRMGVRGYLCKDVEPQVLGEAVSAVMNRGYYYTDYITGKLIHSLQEEEEEDKKPKPLNIREKEFLLLACSELTYNEIAVKMCVSPKTVEGYRVGVFDKLRIKNRVGLVLYAIKNSFLHI